MNDRHLMVWNNCLEIIKDNVPPSSFRTWFAPIIPVRLDADILTIQVPSPFFYEYLEEKYIDIISTTLRKELGTTAKLEYSVVMDNTAYTNNTVNYPTNNKPKLGSNDISLPFETRKEIKNPFIIPGIKKIQIDPQLNTNYRMNNFVEGECNKLAKAAGLAIANQPGGTAYNPLVLYGGSGLGKTHLAQAIGIEAKEKNPDKLVLYVTAERFQTQYTDASRNNTRNDFMHFYQMIDVLIIDDVQEFAGKNSTQNTFFHIFNHLHQSGKQIIMTSDMAPADLKGLEKRLLSRFKWGLSADMQSPEYDTRIKILKQKTYRDGIVMPEDVIDYIAERITSNVRELEGALISLLAQSSLAKRKITLDLAKDIIDKLVSKSTREVSIDFIQKTVCDHFNIDVQVMHSKTRKREVVQARQISMFFAKKLTKASLASIGSNIGGRDHATVLHSCKTVKNLSDTDKNYKFNIDAIARKLRG